MGGNALGHILPGAALLILDMYLLVAQHKVHSHQWSETKALLLGAMVQLIGSVSGIIVEILGGLQYGKPFQAKDHLAMYSSYFVSGIIFALESRGRLPKETWRASLAMASASVSLLFYVHASMQMSEEHNDLESFVHWLLALACAGTSMGFFLSWLFHNQAKVGCMYVALILLLLHAEWFLFLAYALYSGSYGYMGVRLTQGDASSFFVGFGLISTCIMIAFEMMCGLSRPPTLLSGSVLPYTKIDLGVESLDSISEWSDPSKDRNLHIQVG